MTTGDFVPLTADSRYVMNFVEVFVAFRKVFFSTSLLLAVASHAAADDIRARQYEYGYGDTVSAMTTEDAFLVCGNCRNDKLDKLPKQIVSIRMSQGSWPEAAQYDPSLLSDLANQEIPVQPEPETTKAASCGPGCHLGDVIFRFDKDDLMPSELRKLDHIISTLPEKAQLSVSGYTCTVGTSAYNKKLSERRAKKVASYLRNNGVRVESVEGKGECCAVSPDKKINRRVEIIEKRKGAND